MTLPPPKSAQSYERHPLSAVWPDLEPTARQALRESMRQRGYDPLEPVVLYEGRVLDGWHRYSMARELGIEVRTVDYEGDDPAGLVIARHAGRRNLTPKERAHGVVRCRGWAPSGRPADDRKPSQDRGAGVAESRSAGRLSGKPSTNKELAAEADVSERTIRRAKAQVRAKDKKPEASVAGRLEANRAAVQAAATPPGDEIQARAVDAGPVAVSDAHRIRSKPDDEQRGSVAAVVDGDAARLRAGVEPEAPPSLPSLPGEPASEDDGKRRPAGPPVRVEAGAMEAPDVSGRSDSGPDSSLHNESPVALEREASGPATLGLGSTEPAADQASGRSEPSTGAADAKIVMASPAALATSDGGSDSPTEREVVETEAADAAGGPTPSDSASSSDSGSSGSTPTAVPDRELGGADASPDPAPLLPARAAVAGREAADAHAQGVHAATAAQTTSDADAERRRCLSALRTAALRLGEVSRVGTPSGFEAACGLVQALVAAMQRCLEAGLDEQALVAGLPADLVRSLDARLSTETVRATSTQEGSGADGRGRGSAPLEQASNPRAWLRRFGLNRSRQP